jgi:hypothetical protein
MSHKLEKIAFVIFWALVGSNALVPCPPHKPLNSRIDRSEVKLSNKFQSLVL